MRRPISQICSFSLYSFIEALSSQLSALSPHGVQQGCQHSFDLRHILAEQMVILPCEVVEFMGKEELVFHFTGRAQGDLQKAGKFKVRSSPAAFSDVRWYGSTGTAELAPESKDLMLGKSRTRPVHCQGQC